MLMTLLKAEMVAFPMVKVPDDPPNVIPPVEVANNDIGVDAVPNAMVDDRTVPMFQMPVSVCDDVVEDPMVMAPVIVPLAPMRIEPVVMSLPMYKVDVFDIG
jgi:hypothetical protein